MRHLASKRVRTTRCTAAQAQKGQVAAPLETPDQVHIASGARVEGRLF
jgi:hypothetical protein